MTASKPQVREGEPTFDHNQDRYPELATVLTKVRKRIADEVAVVERLEVTCLANGDATYRVWPPRAEEPETGFLPSDTG